MVKYDMREFCEKYVCYAHCNCCNNFELVLYIDFVNQYVSVLPYSELEGGNQVSWPFSSIDLVILDKEKDKTRITFVEEMIDKQIQEYNNGD